MIFIKQHIFRLPRLLLLATLMTIIPFAAQGKEKVGDQSIITDVKIFGRFLYQYSQAQGTTTSFDVADGELRTARIGVSGKIFDDHKFKTEIAINGAGDTIFTSAYIELKPFDNDVKIRLGQFKTPNSLVEDTSSRFIVSHERPAFTDAFALDRRVGAMVSKKTDHYTLSLGVFGQNLEEDTFGGYAIAGRATYMPASSDSLKIHTGASFRYRELDGNQPLFRYRQKPFVHNVGRIVGTERLADSDIFAGVETAIILKSFWTTAEYGVSFVDCFSCAADPVFSGGYVETGFMVGGKRTYKKGKFARPELTKSIRDGGLGAFSFVARLDMLDLEDGAIDGGDYQSAVIGVDWWPTKNVRFGVNGFIANADLGATESGLDPAFASAVADGVEEETVTGINLRFQFDF